MYFKMAPKERPPSPIPEMPAQPETSIGDDPMGASPDAEPDPSDPGEAQEGENSPGSVDPSIAGYMGPEYGPFQCSNCVHFLSPNACHIVAGNIDPQGCCNIFTPGSEGGDPNQPPQDEASMPQPDQQEGEYSDE